MTSLYNLSNDYQNLLSKDEFDEEDMTLLDNLHDAIEDKSIQCAYVIKELEGRLATTEAAIKLAQGKKERIRNNITSLKEYVLDCMMGNHIDKIDKDPLFDIKVRQNPSSVDDYEPTEIPNEYWVKKETIELDKKKVKEDIELGVVVPGARLVRKLSLQIK